MCPRSEAALSVYVHIPWCVRKCPYCDFATRPGTPDSIPHEAYADALIEELRLRWPPGAHLATVFFGGGTPSLWSSSALSRFLRSLEALAAPCTDPVEITVECNPTEFTLCKALRLRDAGVTRLSLGIQSLRATELDFLGRRHNASQARRALVAAAASGLQVSADQIFGLPDQTAEEVLETTRELVDAGVGHLSAYALTIEARTDFGERARRGTLPPIDDHAVAEGFSAISAHCTGTGFTHYEVSNYALKGQRSQHNDRIWHQAPYLGLGVGAVGTLYGPGWGQRWRNAAGLPDYFSSLESHRLPPAEQEMLGSSELLAEALLLGLRTLEGVDVHRASHLAGHPMTAGREAGLARAQAAGELLCKGARWRVPRERWLQLDRIVTDLL